MRSLADTSTLSWITGEVDQAVERVRHGAKLSESLADTGVLPSMAVCAVFSEDTPLRTSPISSFLNRTSPFRSKVAEFILTRPTSYLVSDFLERNFMSVSDIFILP